MQPDVIKKDVTIAEATQKANRIVFKDERGTTYSFFTNKQDGTESQAYQGWKNLKIGDRVQIAYKERASTASNGAPITYRTVAFFREASGINPAPREEVQSSINMQPRDFHWEAIGKTASNIVCAQISAGKTPDVDGAFELATKIVDYPKPFTFEPVQEANEAVDDVNVEDVPF